MNYQLTIVIPSVGNFKSVENLLNSINRQNFNLIEVEVLLVLNGVAVGSIEKFKELYQKYEFSLRLLISQHRGVNIARNLGLYEAKAELILFLDDDCELIIKNTIEMHIKQHNLKSDIFALGGGYQLLAGASFYDKVYNLIQMKWLFSGLLPNLVGNNIFTKHLLGGNFSIKKNIQRKMKILFDENISYGGSELEFFKNAHLLGLKIELVDIDVLHKTNESFSSLALKVYKQGRGARLIDLKFGYNPDELKTDHIKLNVNQDKVYLDFFSSTAILFYNYCFWFGYYSQDKRRYKFMGHILNDIINYLNFKRWQVLKKINR